MAEYKVGASRDLSISKDSGWSGSEAEASIFAYAGWPDNPDAAKAAKGFLCYDASEGDKKGSYHLPFARASDGKLVASASGLRAAASRLPQTAIPDAVKADARAVLDHYFDQLNPDPGTEPDADDKERGALAIWAVPAPITRLYTSDDQPAGSVSHPYIDAANKAAVDPSIFATHPPHFFRAHISNQKVDAYFTRMHESTLRNFAEDATSGVSFQNSHRSTELGFGRSIRGEYMGSPGNGTARTEADFYTVPGLNLNGVSTSDLIDGMRAGLIRDVSVGFYAGSLRCGTCQKRLFSGDCWHVPGLTYGRDGKPTDEPDAPPSIAWVHDARLAEVSAVYDGACPGAAIMKARQVSEAGHLRPDAARLLEARYRIRLPESRQVWGFPRNEPSDPDFTHTSVVQVASPAGKSQSSIMADMARAMARAAAAETGSTNLILSPYPPVTETNEEQEMPENDGRAAPGNESTTRLRALLGTPEERDPLEHACELIPRLRAECERLRPLADELVAGACAEGVRAFGADFNAETNTAWLATQPFEFVRKQREQWAKQADAVLAGGRTSVDQGEPDPKAEPGQSRTDWTPKGAYAG